MSFIITSFSKLQKNAIFLSHHVSLTTCLIPLELKIPFLALMSGWSKELKYLKTISFE